MMRSLRFYGPFLFCLFNCFWFIDKTSIENKIKLTATRGLMAAAPLTGYFSMAMSKLHPTNSTKEIMTTNKTNKNAPLLNIFLICTRQQDHLKELRTQEFQLWRIEISVFLKIVPLKR